MSGKLSQFHIGIKWFHIGIKCFFKDNSKRGIDPAKCYLFLKVALAAKYIRYLFDAMTTIFDGPIMSILSNTNYQ